VAVWVRTARSMGGHAHTRALRLLSAV
jgi:hypothetical protein